MKVITQRDLIRAVADRWAEQYGRGYYANDPTKLAILSQLRAADLERCSAEEIDKIIGNHSWTIKHCNECGRTSTWVIEVGEEPDYESRTATLCRACFNKAVLLVEMTDKANS